VVLHTDEVERGVGFGLRQVAAPHNVTLIEVDVANVTSQNFDQDAFTILILDSVNLPHDHAYRVTFLPSGFSPYSSKFQARSVDYSVEFYFSPSSSLDEPSSSDLTKIFVGNLATQMNTQLDGFFVTRMSVSLQIVDISISMPNGTSSSSNDTSSDRHGLRTGDKIAIGVLIPLFAIIGLFMAYSFLLEYAQNQRRIGKISKMMRKIEAMSKSRTEVSTISDDVTIDVKEVIEEKNGEVRTEVEMKVMDVEVDHKKKIDDKKENKSESSDAD